MLHTPLHQLLGVGPGPITEQMIDAAIAEGMVESDQLDWKRHLPPEREFKTSGIVKDIAAFANSGGGVLVFGVTETQKAASGRADAGDLDESYERTIQSVSYSAISPPVLGVRSHKIPVAGNDNLAAIVVPASVDGPHLTFDGNKQAFSAPLRVNADTHWMNERLLEASYRTRFESARRGREQLEDLFHDMAHSFNPRRNAVLVGAARPRTPNPAAQHREQHEIAELTNQAQANAWHWLGQSDYHPLTDVAGYGARPGLRGWIAPPTGSVSWRQARAAVYDNGAVGLAWEAGGHRYGATGTTLPAHHVPADAVEGFVAALLALIKTVTNDAPAGDVELIVGVEWEPSEYTPAGDERLNFEAHHNVSGGGSTTTLGGNYRPVYRVVDPSQEETLFIRTVVDVATDCLNQAGIRRLAKLTTELPPRS
ncbi:helix-turn-helix domain-containing protein [Microbacterium sp. LWH12-1.2]|uniref:AlbA family DNA-binding domain-containing protein n=1 Tax=Microbacterium sp. LWH12-1.2 TaxID=3135259 RepID=UPI00342C422C